MSRIKYKEEKGRKCVLTNEGTPSVTFINYACLEGERELENNDKISVVDSSFVVIYFDPYDEDQKKYPKKLTESYVILNTLGAGSFGEVRLAMSHQDCSPRAIKCLDPSKYSDLASYKKYLDGEVNALQKLNHNCIIQYYGVVESLYVIMEYAKGGELPKDLPETVRLISILF